MFDILLNINLSEQDIDLPYIPAKALACMFLRLISSRCKNNMLS